MISITGIQFLMWHAPKDSLLKRIDDACEAYTARFGVEANVIVVPSCDEGVTVDGAVVIPKTTVARGTVWAGRQEGGAA